MGTLINQNGKTERVFKPAVDIVEREEGLLVYADMPGVSADALDITLEKNMLTLHGKAGDTVYQRAFTLSKRIDQDNIDAMIKDGVLTLVLPKPEQVAPISRRIAVKTA